MDLKSKTGNAYEFLELKKDFTHAKKFELHRLLVEFQYFLECKKPCERLEVTKISKIIGFEQGEEPKTCVMYLSPTDIDKLWFLMPEIMQEIPIPYGVESPVQFRLLFTEDQMSKVMYFLPEQYKELRDYFQRAGENILNW